MKLNYFRCNVTDISAKKEALLQTQGLRCGFLCRNGVLLEMLGASDEIAEPATSSPTVRQKGTAKVLCRICNLVPRGRQRLHFVNCVQ